jgi:abortive infection bacteriophage resistance protein
MCVKPILKLLYCGRHLPVPSSWPLLRGCRHSGSDCSNVVADVDRKRVAYLRHPSINMTATQEHTLQNWTKIIFVAFDAVYSGRYVSTFQRNLLLQLSVMMEAKVSSKISRELCKSTRCLTAVGKTSFTKLTDWLNRCVNNWPNTWLNK